MYRPRCKTLALSAALLAWLSLVGLGAAAAAEPGRVTGARLWQSPDGTRLVFDLDRPLANNVYTLNNPHRVVIDIADAKLTASLAKLKLAGTPLRSVQHIVRRNKELRIVLTLKESMVLRTMVLKPNQQYGHRLVVDLEPRPTLAATRSVAKATPPPAVGAAAKPSGKRAVVIAIDAGHGGEDPGARGPGGTREKDVALAVARRLAQLVAKEPGMRAVLTRDGDYFIPLRRRMEKARMKQADLFVSIHADAAHNTRASGSSVYTLSAKGASSEAARWLADKENASDLIGGVSLDDKDGMLATVLLDLAQNATNDASQEVGTSVLRALRRTGELHHDAVQSAGFMVLKSPDVPSILVETAFISNPQEERKLRSPAFQQQMAEAILDGLRAHLDKRPIPGTLLAARRRHVIERGETLSEIAAQYQVRLQALIEQNNLQGKPIRPGQVLEIPGASDS